MTAPPPVIIHFPMPLKTRPRRQHLPQHKPLLPSLQFRNVFEASPMSFSSPSVSGDHLLAKPHSVDSCKKDAFARSPNFGLEHSNPSNLSHGPHHRHFYHETNKSLAKLADLWLLVEPCDPFMSIEMCQVTNL